MSDSTMSVLRKHRLFHGVCDTAVAQCAQFARVRRASEGDSLWREGESSETFGMIDEGLVAITREGTLEGTAILAFCGPGDVIGLVAAFGARPYPARATVLSASTSVVVFRAEPILALTKQDPAVATCFNRALVEQARVLHTKIDVLSAGAVPSRLASLFRYLGQRFGEPLPDGRVRIPFLVSRQQLAHFVSARIETVIRTLSLWKRQGWFATIPTGFELDLTAAEAHLEQGM